jgi:uncharacterized protein (DUF427 family)
MTVRAVWNGQVLAESDKTIVVEGNHYFPPDAVRRAFFAPSETHTTCPWKGLASYYTVNVDGAHNPDAAWYYPAPKDAAAKIRDYVAFWHGVTVEKVSDEA